MLADLVVLIHLAFVVFVVVGGVLVLRWRWLAWLHVPAAIWGVAIELAGWICPLTPLENWLRERAGGTIYGGGFVEHYLLSVLYPSGLTRSAQLVLGAFVLAINLALYAVVAARGARSVRTWQRSPSGHSRPVRRSMRGSGMNQSTATRR